MGSAVIQRHEACASCLCIDYLVFTANSLWPDEGLPPGLKGIEVIGAARAIIYPG